MFVCFFFDVVTTGTAAANRLPDQPFTKLPSFQVNRGLGASGLPFRPYRTHASLSSDTCAIRTGRRRSGSINVCPKRQGSHSYNRNAKAIHHHTRETNNDSIVLDAEGMSGMQAITLLADTDRDLWRGGRQYRLVLSTRHERATADVRDGLG